MINILRILGALVPSTRSLAVAALMGGGLMAVGCGQKGPLYMPTAAETQSKPAKSVQPTIADEVDDEVKDRAPR